MQVSSTTLANGHPLENWAIFEDWAVPDRFPIRRSNSQRVAEDDPDLLEALRILGACDRELRVHVAASSGLNMEGSFPQQLRTRLRTMHGHGYCPA